MSGLGCFPVTWLNAFFVWFNNFETATLLWLCFDQLNELDKEKVKNDFEIVVKRTIT